MLVTNHVHQIGTTLISKKVFDSLSAEEQGWLMEANDVFQGFRPILRGAQNGLLKKIADAGIPVHHLTDDERALWVAEAEKAQPQIVAEMGGDSVATWDAIQKAKKACGG